MYEKALAAAAYSQQHGMESWTLDLKQSMQKSLWWAAPA
jgi:hypothetical protein